MRAARSGVWQSIIAHRPIVQPRAGSCVQRSRQSLRHRGGYTSRVGHFQKIYVYDFSLEVPLSTRKTAVNVLKRPRSVEFKMATSD